MTSTRSTRLLLRPPRSDDLEAIWSIHGDPETNRFNPAGPMSSRGDAIRLLERWEAHWREHGFGYWAVTSFERPSLVIGFGGVMLRDLRGAQRLNLYFRLAPAAWGQGYATELGRAALAAAFDQLHHDAVCATVRASNQPSIAVLERLGFRPDGTITDEHGDSRVYVRLRCDAQ